MSYDARVSAAEYHVNVRDRKHPDIHRMHGGFRIEHLRQQYTEIFHRVREGFDGHHEQDNFRERIGAEGVKTSTLRKIFDGYRELREREELLDPTGGLTGSRGAHTGDEVAEFEPREFPAEYIGLADFRVCDAQYEFGGTHGPLDPGTYYKHRLSAEMDGTWGIVIDLDRVNKQLNAIAGLSPSVPRGELFGALFMFNLFHEHFHYLTELAAMKLSGVEKRFKLYQQYLENAKWDDWFCDLKDCCKIRDGPDDWRLFESSGVCRKAGCSVGALSESKTGYQYPVEEAMANAHAVKYLKKLIRLYDGFNVIFPFIKSYIRTNQPLGYAEFNCFRMRDRFHLGERIMTRLLRGDVSMPDVNILQHEMIEGCSPNIVLDMEKEMFSGLLLTENAYTTPIVPDDMAEVPVYILNCDKFPLWEQNIDKYLC